MNDGEKKIYVDNKKFYVDGFCEKTNTIFEFYGCFWHGCKKCYKEEILNPISRKTMKDLYNKTISRETIIREKGYNIEIIWECEYNKD